MTAVVAVLNKSAVALAADSKVTVGSTDHNKTYDTVNKLFALSKTEPVGIMVYGNAEYMEFPWETVIKDYRKQLGSNCYSQVSDYAEYFIEFLTTFFDFTDEDQIKNVIHILSSQFQEITRIYRSQMRRAGTALKEKEAKSIFKNVVKEFLDYSSDLDNWKATKRITKPRLKRLYGEVIDVLIESNFGKWPTPQAKGWLQEIALNFLRKNIYSNRSSGIVLAGFGDDEYFPTLVSYELDGVIDGRLKYRQTHYNDLSRRELGVIVPFAQDDMMYRFMEGIDPNYSQFMEGLMSTLFHDSAQAIIDKYIKLPKRQLDRLKSEIANQTSRSLNEAMEKARNFRQEYFVDNIMEMIILLPKEELANLAESLVSLTSQQMRVSSEMESVGGPIDVAVISKGDGFIWIKRKHYFDASLNPSFFRNYSRNIDLGA